MTIGCRWPKLSSPVLFMVKLRVCLDDSYTALFSLNHDLTSEDLDVKKFLPENNLEPVSLVFQCKDDFEPISDNLRLKLLVAEEFTLVDLSLDCSFLFLMRPLNVKLMSCRGASRWYLSAILLRA